jgi:hypothetical protein
MTKWLYGDAWERFPIEAGHIWGLGNGSRVAVHDIFEPLPAWMRADLVFVDPPWNLGNLNTFYTKAAREDYKTDFKQFADVLFQRIGEIGARTAYIEIGNQAVKDWEQRLSLQYPFVQRWPVLYYRKHPTNLLRGGDVPISYDYSGIDEAKCIQILAEIEHYTVLADPCMGRGLAGMAAYRAGHAFVGTELNRRRLAVLLAHLADAGAEIMRFTNG